MKKKILIITNEFIPFTLSLGGVVRVLSLSNYLIKNNIEVFILTSKKDFKGFFGYEDLLSNINIHYINDNNNKQPSIFFNFFLFPVKIFRRLFPKFFNLLVFCGIDQAYFNINKYRKISSKLLTDHNINNLLISSPPFSLFSISSYIKSKHKNINIIHDYRDSWVLRFDYKDNYIQKFIYSTIEHKTMKYCNHILCATETISKKIKNHLAKYIYRMGGSLSATELNIVTVMNGFHHQNDESIFKIKNKLIKDKQIINIGYFGIIDDNKNSYRDVGVIYNEAIKHKVFFDSVKFHFYGPSNIKNKKILKNKNFNFNRPLDHVNALKKMLEMDYLLIVHTEAITATEVLTGKLFDYIFVGKPIIVISRGETEAGKLVINNKLGLNINLLKKTIYESIKELTNSPIQIKRNINLIKRFSRDNQNNKILDILI